MALAVKCCDVGTMTLTPRPPTVPSEPQQVAKLPMAAMLVNDGGATLQPADNETLPARRLCWVSLDVVGGGGDDGDDDDAFAAPQATLGAASEHVNDFTSRYTRRRLRSPSSSLLLLLWALAWCGMLSGVAYSTVFFVLEVSPARYGVLLGVRWAVMIFVPLALYFWKDACVFAAAAGRRGGTEPQRWAFAASEDAFRENVKSLRGGISYALLLLVVSVPTSAVWFYLGVSDALPPFVRATCAHDPRMMSWCSIACLGCLVASAILHTLFFCLVLPVVIAAPIDIWDPMSSEAARQTAQELLLRMRWLRMFGARSSPSSPRLTPCGLGVLCGYYAAGTWWFSRLVYAHLCGPLEVLAFDAMVAISIGLVMGSYIYAVVQSRDKGITAPAATNTLGRGAWLERMLSTLSSKEASISQQRIILLVVIISQSAIPFGGRLRLAQDGMLMCMLAMALFIHDRPMRMHELVAAGQPAFGLVVDARQLRQALDALLRGEAGDGLSGRVALSTYKASISRMAEALAVSYRWQQDEVLIAPGMSLNMSAWQLTNLRDALAASTCPYVWLDRLSVPQSAERAASPHFDLIQRQLLSRMSSVYTVAAVTLALRSLEREGSRYHQRG